MAVRTLWVAVLLISMNVSGTVFYRSRQDLQQELHNVPIDNKRLVEIREKVDFKGNVADANNRLFKLIESELNLVVPSWFLDRANRPPYKEEEEPLERNLAKPIFRFHKSNVINVFEVRNNPHTVVFSGDSWKIEANTSKIKFLRYRSADRSGVYVGKKIKAGVVVVGDQPPHYPIAVISNNGEHVWGGNIRREFGYSGQLELEVFETSRDFVCFAADNKEYSIQTFDKADGSTGFWWSSALYHKE